MMAVDLNKVQEYKETAIAAQEAEEIKFSIEAGKATLDTLKELPLERAEAIYYGVHALAGTLTENTDFPFKPVIPEISIPLDDETFRKLTNPAAPEPAPVVQAPVPAAENVARLQQEVAPHLAAQKAAIADNALRVSRGAPVPRLATNPQPVKVAPLTPPTQVQPTATRPVQVPTVKRPGQ